MRSLAKRIIPDANGTEANVLLDKRLISAPPLAVSQCMERTIEMAEGAKDALHEALASILDFKEKAVSGVEEKEQMLDEMEDKLSTFLLELSSVSLTDSDSRTVTELLHCISDFERISDHVINMIVTVSIIQIANSSMNSHDYLNGLNAEWSLQFIESYNAYGQKYRLAIN